MNDGDRLLKGATKMIYDDYYYYGNVVMTGRAKCQLLTGTIDDAERSHGYQRHDKYHRYENTDQTRPCMAGPDVRRALLLIRNFSFEKFRVEPNVGM
jgi:hypothetical protein